MSILTSALALLILPIGLFELVSGQMPGGAQRWGFNVGSVPRYVFASRRWLVWQSAPSSSSAIRLRPARPSLRALSVCSSAASSSGVANAAKPREAGCRTTHC